MIEIEKKRTRVIPLFVEVVLVIQVIFCIYMIYIHSTSTEEKVFKANLKACEYRQDKYDNGFSSEFDEFYFKVYNALCEVQDYLTVDSPVCKCNAYYENGNNGPTIKKYPFQSIENVNEEE